MATLMCLHWKGPWVDPDLILKALPYRVMQYWMYVYSMQPFGPEREDERAKLTGYFSLAAMGADIKLGELMDQFDRDVGGSGTSGPSPDELARIRKEAQEKNKAVIEKIKQRNIEKGKAAIPQATHGDTVKKIVNPRFKGM